MAVVLLIANLTSLLHFDDISGDFGGAMVLSRAKIHMARTSEAGIPPKSTKKVRLGIYCTQIQSSDHDIVAISIR